MAEVIVPNDIVEQILVNLDVKDLIACKTVCKSWHSLISKSRFVKSHLQKSYNKDQNHNPEIRHRRIGNTAWMFYNVSNRYEVDYDTHIIGSSNGLVCISRDNREFFVFNPSTREVKKLTNPDIREVKISLYDLDEIERDSTILCSGFGYDSSIDDYKVVLGFVTYSRKTCFLVLNLKSNVWKVIEEEIDYICSNSESRFGTLCNGSIYWFMINEYSKEVKLVAFDLSDEEFKEISQPDILGYQFTKGLSLGIFNDCLCIYHSSRPKFKKWVVKNDDLGRYWELLDYDDDEFSNNLVINLHGFSQMQSELQTQSVSDSVMNLPKCFIDDPNIGLSTTWENVGVRGNFDVWFLTYSEDIGDPIFVQSLVSPHGKKKRKRREMDRNGGRKKARF